MAGLVSVPAPVGGWNTTSSIVSTLNTPQFALNQINPNEAVILDNLIPAPGGIINRLGASNHATSVGSGNVDSLFELKAANVNKFVAAASGNIYDVSSSGVAISIASGFSSNQWQGTVFNGQLGLVNGKDAPQVYDGTTVAAMTVSGPSDITLLNTITTFKNRSYFTLTNSQSFWYSPLSTLGGALTEFPLGKVGQFGGNLVAIQTITKDGGSGQDDAIAFFMSSGEIIVYEGISPATDFVLTGVFKAGRPITSRAVSKFGPDILAITDQGFLTASSLLPLSFGKDNSILGVKIKGAAAAAAANYASSFGWQIILSPSNNLVIVNVPQSNNTFVQYVLNVNTLGWCRFTGLNARCFATFGNTLYFGTTDGRVAKYGPNYTDFDSPYTAIYQSPYFRLIEGKFQNTAFYPQIRFSAASTLTIKHSTDFKPFTSPYSVSYSTIGAQWGDPWGSSWNDPNAIINFLSLNTIGYAVSINLTFQSAGSIDFFNTDFLVEESSKI